MNTKSEVLWEAYKKASKASCEASRLETEAWEAFVAADNAEWVKETK